MYSIGRYTNNGNLFPADVIFLIEESASVRDKDYICLDNCKILDVKILNLNPNYIILYWKDGLSYYLEKEGAVTFYGKMVNDNDRSKTRPLFVIGPFISRECSADCNDLLELDNLKLKFELYE